MTLPDGIPIAGKKIREYTKEFRQEGVKLSQKLSSVPGAAKKLGISAGGVLYAYQTNFKNDGTVEFTGKGKLEKFMSREKSSQSIFD